MRKILCLLLSLTFGHITAQIDYSDQWEDFYSYNNVKEFIKVGDQIYAIVDNAVFIFNTTTGETQKLSSIQGLSGESTSSIHYSQTTERLIIGYESGLLEIIDSGGKITVNNDIERLNITGAKSVNDIAEFGDNLLLSTPFAVVVYQLDKLQFGDTYFIGFNSSPVYINQIEVWNDRIYAATKEGIFSADINEPNLIDFNKWTQPQGNFIGDYQAIAPYNTRLYASKENNLYEVVNESQVQLVKSIAENITHIQGSVDYLGLTTMNAGYVLNPSLATVARASTNAARYFNISITYAEGDQMYLGTAEYGILQAPVNNTATYIEIHPEGPVSNDIFSITADRDQLWVVYGGYDAGFTPQQRVMDYSHYNGENWINTPFNFSYPARDLVHVTMDPNNTERVYISSFAQTITNFPDHTGGLLVVENDEPIQFLNHTNSGLEDLAPDNPNYSSVRINGTAFDNQGNLWVSNSWVSNKLKKWAPGGGWTSYDLSGLFTNQALGLTELIVDRTGNVWMGSRRNGVLAYNPSNDKKRALITEATKGSLPDPNVRSLAVDRNNRIWIGTKKGLVVFSNAAGLFDAEIYDASPIIVDDDGIAKKLLGDQPLSSIAIDGADNKWFGTDTGGVLATNPSGNETLFNFNNNNSPLPSNKIIKIKVDNSNGKVFIATDKGIVAFNNNVAPFGDELGEVYAYPNPVKKEHAIVTIDGRNDSHLPRGTNVKIVDAAGRLVYETNVLEGQELKGGKVIWDKTNLAGRRVASGVYIVLLTLPDKSETAICKIAIIN